MNTKRNTIIAGFILTIIGIGMFCFGVAMFSYNGPPISEFVSKAGEFSFFLWLPVLFVGIVILIVGITMKKSVPYDLLEP